MILIKDENSPDSVNLLDLGNELKFIQQDTFAMYPSYKINNEHSRFKSLDMSIPGYKIKKYEYDNFDLNNKKYTNYIKHDFREENAEKLFIYAAPNIYHFFIDTIPHIASFIEKFPDSLIIIDYLDIAVQNNIVYAKVLTEYLQKNNINYVLLDTPYLVAINNFYYIDVTNFSDFKIDLLYDIVKPYIDDINKKPTKKVYLSRKNVSARIEDENILESFFSENGFEIVFPEDFQNVEDQVSFFNDVHTLVSSTSAGILNSIFMQPGGTVIELIVPKPLFTPINGMASIHSEHFLLMSFTKRHKYFGIRTPKNGSDIIKYIKDDPALVSFIQKR